KCGKMPKRSRYSTKSKSLFCHGGTSSFCRLPTRAPSYWLNTLLGRSNARYGKIFRRQSDIWRSPSQKPAVKEEFFATSSSCAKRGYAATKSKNFDHEGAHA